MEILFVASWYPSKLHPKNGNFIEQHAHAVKSAGCNLVVIHPVYSNRILVPEIKAVYHNEILVYYIFIPRVLKNFERVNKFMLNKLIYILNDSGFTPEIIHGHVIYPSGNLALSLKNHYSVPLVITEHWSGYKKVNSNLFTEEVEEMATEVLGRADLILPVSHDLAKNMEERGFKGHYSVVNNTVNTSVFYHLKRETKEVFRFLHISNFEARAKNTEGIIRAFVKGEFENATLTIAGDGDIDKMRDYAQSLNTDITQIEFKGSLEYEEVADLMRSSDCFVLFSNFENLPCVIAESHCCGLPVLATNVGGVPEMVDDSNGLLVPPGNEKKLIAGMREMIEHRNRYTGMMIAKVAAKRYSFEAIGQELCKHYAALLNSLN